MKEDQQQGISARTRQEETTGMLLEMDLKLETQDVEQKGRTSDGTRQLVSEMKDFATSGSTGKNRLSQTDLGVFGSLNPLYGQPESTVRVSLLAPLTLNHS